MSEKNTKLSPVIAIAATSVTLFSLVGIGVLTGIIPSSYSQPGATPTASAPPHTASPGPAAAERQPTPARAARTPSEPARVASGPAAPRRTAAVCAHCGTVSAVDVVETKGEGSGLGAVAGGVVGGVLGNQIGGGSGRKIATVAGVAGGALAGHELEKRYKSERDYRVTVRMDDGTTRTFTYETEPAYQPGDKVKIVEGRLAR